MGIKFLNLRLKWNLIFLKFIQQEQERCTSLDSLIVEKIFLRNVNLFLEKNTLFLLVKMKNKYNEFFKTFFDSQIYLIIKTRYLWIFMLNEILKKILLSIFEFKK